MLLAIKSKKETVFAFSFLLPYEIYGVELILYKIIILNKRAKIESKNKINIVDQLANFR